MTVELLSRALSLDGTDAGCYSNLGLALQEQGKLDEAIARYHEALAIKPQYPDALNNLGLALQAQGKLDEAIARYHEALAIKPQYPKALNNLGLALHAQGKLGEAIARYHEALAIKPQFPEAQNNLGNALQEQGKLDEAIARYHEALAIEPQYPEALNNLGLALKAQGKLGEAIARYHEALAIKPQYPEALNNLGDALQKQGKLDEAIARYELALETDADYLPARWNRAISVLPIIFTHAEQTQACREAFRLELIGMNDWFVGKRLDDGYKAVGCSQPFYLAYQEENNKQLLAEYGALCHKLMSHWQQQEKCFPESKPFNIPVRLGIVSNHVYRHSVWNALMKGWIRHLDRSRFEVSIFYVGTKTDEETQYARSVATSFVEGRATLPSWVEAILASRIDILLYPEIGMDLMTVKLASLRLAPIQVGAWGHPETTGLRTMDYYLSADLLEPNGSEKYYTEELIKLPNLGCCYGRSAVTPIAPDLVALGIAENCPLLVCPGVPFKYAPQHDRIFTELAKQLGRCQFIFFIHEGKELSQLVKERLTLRFSEEGLHLNEFCVFVPWQTQESFYGLMQRADVYLDTIGFSGFNTAMQATECGLPIVTREGQFMRGRLASGILKRIGLQELVADNEDHYVALAVKLASDRQYNRTIRQKIEANRRALYDDLEPVRALEYFLVEACRKSAGETGNTVPLQSALPESEAARPSKETSVPTPAAFVWQQLDGALHMQTLKQDYAPVGLLEMISPIPQRVLDVGCFCGGTGKWLKEKFSGCRVTGIEYLDAAVAIAAKTYDQVLRGRIEDIDFDREGIRQGSLDIIVAADVLEHLYNPWRALERLRPLLAPNGAIYVSLPNIRNLNILKALAEGRWQYSGAGILDITHIRFFTRTQAIEMLEQTGWQVVAQRINLDPSLSPLLQGQDVSKIHRVDAGSLKLENLSEEDVRELFALQFFLKAIPMETQKGSEA